MTTDTAANPRGIFNRGALGAKIGPVTVQVERGRIRFFAEVLGATDPLHFDLEAARSAGHPDLVAPPSFFVVIEAAANAELKRRGAPSAAERVNCDYRYLLHGDERYFHQAPLYAGDEVQFSSRVAEFYDKKGGAMEFVTFESTIAHEKRGLLVRSRRTLLHRLPPDEATS